MLQHPCVTQTQALVFNIKRKLCNQNRNLAFRSLTFGLLKKNGKPWKQTKLGAMGLDPSKPVVKLEKYTKAEN